MIYMKVGFVLFVVAAIGFMIGYALATRRHRKYLNNVAHEVEIKLIEETKLKALGLIGGKSYKKPGLYIEENV